MFKIHWVDLTISVSTTRTDGRNRRNWRVQRDYRISPAIFAAAGVKQAWQAHLN